MSLSQKHKAKISFREKGTQSSVSFDKKPDDDRIVSHDAFFQKHA